MNRKLYLMLLMAFAMPLAMMGQEPVTVNGDNPFSDNFEGTECEWEFVNGTSTNAWYWGTATNNGGTHAVYISQDGGETNTYNLSATTWVYFYKLITLGNASYRFSYDWKCYGQSSYDYIRVGLLPASTTLTQGSSLPSGWISLDDGSYLNVNSNWSTKSVNLNNVTEGTYKMVFAWRNNASSGTQPPGAIDNVAIEELVIDNHTYLTQTSNTDFMKGLRSGVNVTNGSVSLQGKMASIADWNATTSLPATRRKHQVVTWRNYVYCVGGNPSNYVYRATQQASGVSEWTSLNSMPVALKDMAVIATQTQLVVAGGRNNNGVSDKIYSAAINDDGTIGTWKELPFSLPQPCWGARAVEALGHIYIIGGANTDTENDATDKVYRLIVNAVGEVTGITEVANMPEARNGHAATVYDSKIIVTGGYNADFTPKNTVYTVVVNLDGNLGSWQTNTALPNAIYGHTSVCTNGILTVIGGKEGDLESNKFYYADADASTYDWQLSDNLLPERCTEGASFAFGNKIFYCGGANMSGTANSAVRYMAVTPSTTPVNHPVFVSWPFNVGTPKMMDEFNYTLTNTGLYTYEVFYRTASDDDFVFGEWTSAGTEFPATVNQTKSFIQYMFRITATGEDDFVLDDVTLTLSGCSQLAGNLDWIGTLTAEKSPYLVTENVSFTTGTHNIEPGVVIQFMPGTGLNITQASLNFNGTEESPILLTSYEADNSRWNGVYYNDYSDYNGLTSVMNYTIIEKAGNGDNHANLYLNNTNQPSISHCSFNQSANDGIYCYYSNPAIDSCTFDGNRLIGLYLYYSSPTCTSCTMNDNMYGLYLYDSAPTCTDCTMTGNSYAGIYFATTNFNASLTGLTCSNNQYGMYSCSPNRSFNFDDSIIAFEDNEADIAMAGGQINSSRTWNYYTNGYVLLGTVNVYNSSSTSPKLTIAAGNTIRVATGCYLYVGSGSSYGGQLYAVGTETAPITFTSLNGAAGGWNGLYFNDGSDYNSSTSSLRYCVVENATTNLYCSNTNQPSVMWCSFQNATNQNVSLYYSNISIEGSTLRNAPRGLYLEYNSSPTMISTVFESHSEACVRYNSDYGTVTYSGCTMKDSQYGIYYYSPNFNIPNFTNIVSFENNTYDIVVPEGYVNSNRTWGANSYTILGNIYFENNNSTFSTLTLSPGSVLKFAQGKQLYVGYRGSLYAEGTAEQPITFTSMNGQSGGWNGLCFEDNDSYSGQQSSLKHCIVENGNEYNLRMYYTNQPSLIENCAFQNSNGYGLYFDQYSSPVVSKSTIKDNASYGIYVYYYSSPIIKKSTIRNNGSHGVYVNSYSNPIVGGSAENACSIYNNAGRAVYNTTSSNLNMTHNFWGNISTKYIDNNLIYDKLDNSSYGRVNFEPISWFPVGNFESLQGTIAYGDNKPMANLETNLLNSGDTIVASATTNSNGMYEFSNYDVDVYNTWNADFDVDILAGVNATDALLVMRHYVHLDTIVGGYATAADVNGSNNINGTDAMLIMRRAVDGSFPVGDFFYYNPNNISVSGDTCNYNLSYLCYGDVNGSFTPQTRDNSIELVNEGQRIAGSYQEIELPVSIKQAAEIGALTLYFDYPEEYLEIEDVVLAATGESLVFAAADGKLSIAWFSLQPVTLAENDGLILIKVNTKDLSNLNEPVAFNLEAYSELADGAAQVNEDVVIAMPEIVTQTMSVNDNMTNNVRLTVYPNPVKEVCRLGYQLTEAGRVTVSVYNMMGVKMMDAVDCRQEEGKHEVQLNTASLAAGTYCCRITFEGESSWVKTTMLIIEK